MQDNALLYLRDWFHQYVQGFYSTDEQLQFHVRLKEEHTLRVIEQARFIAKRLSCSPEQLVLAEIAALLHDIGRFKQYQTYRTFNDALSINHAELGRDILEQLDILNGAGLSTKHQEIVKKAVLYHNRRYLPLNIGEEDCLFAKIIRDADKLDIFSMLVTGDQENKIPHSPELKRADQYSLHIIEDILQGRLVKRDEITTSSDLMLFRLSWIFDINFACSFLHIIEQHYIEKLITTLPDTDDIKNVYQYIKQYAEQHTPTY